MIELYRTAHCPACDEVEAALVELVVAHKVIVVEAGQTDLPPNTPLPAIKEKARLISEPEALSAYLKELTRFVTDWRRFQGDFCYVDEHGESC